jgi:hypothetical protein
MSSERFLGALLIGAVLAVAGCGSDIETIATSNPEVAFAPLVQLDPQERRMPLSARRFIDRSRFWFSHREGCPDEKIAVGRTLGEEQNERINWIFAVALGKGPFSYFRNGDEPDCERRDDQYTANQYTRPFGAGNRPKGLLPEEGYYLDLVDAARSGTRPATSGGQPLVRVPAYAERRDEEVDGDDGVRLVYWLLYGMNEPRANGAPIDRLTHEGDWERVDVLLRKGDEEGAYEPVSVRVRRDGRWRDVPWDSLQRTAGAGADGESHPVLSAELGSHELAPARRPSCSSCPEWRTWGALAEATTQLWYRFGGAWGDVGTSSATTGAVGPHREWSRGRIEAIEHFQREAEQAEEDEGV